MKSVMRITVSYLVVVGCHAGVESAVGSPWRSSTDLLAPFPQTIELALVVEPDEIDTYEPVIARITLTNRDNEPLKLKVRQDGAPRSVASLVARADGPFERHHQWLRTSGPSSQEISLAPGESTTGEILILFGGPPTGFPFSEPGHYWVKFACQPDRHFAPVYSNAVRVSVTRDDCGNAPLLDELSEIMYSRYGWDRESVIRGNGEDYIPGIEILKRVIKVRQPHLVDPERNPGQEKEAEFVELMTDLLDRHPDSSYSGYIARFLGLVHIKTFEHEISHRGTGYWGETKASPDHKEVTQVCESEYEKALRYMTIASQTDLWPRTTAALHLARLYGMAEEWDKVRAVCDKLRTDYAEQNGAALADKLQSEMRKYREKIARRKKAD